MARRPTWGLSEAVVGFLVGFLASNLAVLAYLASEGALDDPDALDRAPLWTAALFQVALWIGLLGAPIWATARKGRRSLAADFGLWQRAADVPVGLLAGALTQFVLIPLLYLPLFELIGERDLGEPARRLTERAEGAGVVLLGLVIVVGAPVVEELFFRGLLLRALQDRMPTWVAVGVSSVVFALAHFQVLQLPALVAFGVVTGVLAVRTGRLGPSIWAHVVFNGLAMYQLVTS